MNTSNQTETFAKIFALLSKRERNWLGSSKKAYRPTFVERNLAAIINNPEKYLGEALVHSDTIVAPNLAKNSKGFIPYEKDINNLLTELQNSPKESLDKTNFMIIFKTLTYVN